MTDLQVIDSFSIDTIQTKDDIDVFLKKLDRVESLLKATEKWHENICKYCHLEAMGLCRIAELDFSKVLNRTTTRGKTVYWLSTLSIEKKQEIIDECAKEGISIISIYKRDYLPQKRKEDALDKLKITEGMVDYAFQHDGIVKLHDYYYKDDSRKIQEYLGKDVYANQVEGIRKKLKLNGGYGVGDNEGTYVKGEMVSEYIEEVIDTRIYSMLRDFRHLSSLASDAEKDGFYIHDVAYISRGNCHSSRTLDEDSLFNFMLCGLGLRKPHICGDNPIPQANTINMVLNVVDVTIGSLIDLLVIGANQNINWFTNVLGDSEYFGKNLSCQGNSSKLAKLFADIFDELRMQNKRN